MACLASLLTEVGSSLWKLSINAILLHSLDWVVVFCAVSYWRIVVARCCELTLQRNRISSVEQLTLIVLCINVLNYSGLSG